MKMTGHINDFEDPLLSSVKKRPKTETITQKQAAEKPEARSTPAWRWVTIILAFLAVGGLTYYLVQAQSQIEKLSNSLTASQGQLSSVSDQLRQSQEQIGSLEQGLSQSQTQAAVQKGQLRAQASQYRSLYSELKEGQQRQGEELASVGQQKADRTEVNDLRNETGEIKKQVTEANSNISDLRQATSRNAGEIESTKTAVASVREATDANRKTISDVQYSLARDVYNFELTENTGIMKVDDVSLRLRKVELSKQRYDMEIFTGNKRLKKTGQLLNEPIYFFVTGAQKPYELVVTKLDKKHVIGYLSVPKK
jgi:chromosome segregation ATPase